MSKQAGPGVLRNGNSSLQPEDNKHSGGSDVTSSGHDAAAKACEGSSGLMMADGCKADDVTAGEAEVEAAAVVSAIDTPTEAQGRQVSSPG